MKSSLTSLTLLCATLLSGAALADNSSSMLGTWTGVSNVAVIGDAPKHHEPGDGSGVKFVKTDFTIVIEAQEGRNFSGHWKSDSHEENIAGALMNDMKSGVIVDSDGSATFKRINANVLDLCYVHLPSANNKSSVALCSEYRRQ
jgi:hypothetical protein